MPIEPINLQPYKIANGALDYPVKHNGAMDGQESKINEMVDAVNEAVDVTIPGQHQELTDLVDERLDNQDAVLANLSGAMTSGVTFKGTHSAAGGTYPASPSVGDYWIISVAGAISNIAYNVGDSIIYTSGGWIVDRAGPDMSRINPKALANAIHMTSGASGGAIRALSNVNNNLGTADFTLIWRGALPDWSPGTTVQLWAAYQDNDNRALFYIDSSSGGTLRVRALVGGVEVLLAASTTTLESAGLAPWATAELSVSVVRETALAAGSAVFAVNGVQLGTPTAIPAASTASISNTGAAHLCALNTDVSGRAESITHAAYLYNRALTVAELLDHAVTGVNAADIGASNVPVYQSNYSAGAGGAVPTLRCAIVGGQTLLGDNDWLKVTVNEAGGSAAFLTGPTGSFNNNEYRDTKARLRIGYQVYIPGTNSGSVGFFVGPSATATVRVYGLGRAISKAPSGGAGNSQGSAVTDTDEIVTILFESDGSITTGNLVSAITGWIVGPELGDVVYVREVSGTKVGNIARYEPDGIQAGGQWLDSANGNHALVPASGATVMRPPLINQQRGTNTWSATSETQYVGGFNQAVLPANSALTTLDIHSTGSVTVHIGDGADVDRYGASVALVVGRNRVSLLTPFNDGTNLKLTLTPTASFTGTLKTTATYQLQEA